MTEFTSGLAPYIRSLITLKHAVGFPYQESERHLRHFDVMCARDHPGQTELTREMAAEWVVLRPREHSNGLLPRITPVRQLAKHMTRLGANAHVIASGIPGKQVRYRPHLFTPEQLRALFSAADNIQPSPYGGQRQLIIPMIFRMIYCLGLRPGEAVRLHRNDVDLAQGSARILESKGHTDRIVFFSADLHDACLQYEEQVSWYHPNRVAFFPGPNGDCYQVSTLSRWFRELIHAVGPVSTWHPGSPPRPYDLRHAHVVERINRATRAGQDPAELVAYLSQHLGHQNPEHTWYYFHLAVDFHPDFRSLANTDLETTLTGVIRDEW